MGNAGVSERNGSVEHHRRDKAIENIAGLDVRQGEVPRAT
jgi:hypothetical protein